MGKESKVYADFFELGVERENQKNHATAVVCAHAGFSCPFLLKALLGKSFWVFFAILATPPMLFTHFPSKQFWVKRYSRIAISGAAVDPMDLIREGKIRRYFRATQKLNVPDLVSHITQRAAGKEPSFLEDSDYLTMIGLLKETTEKYSLRIFAFCLMPNHVHLLFSPREPNLYDAMRYLFSRYAMRFNRKYERKGHLFGGPYRQSVCLDDSYLLAASLYIHQNPLKAGLTTDPLSYRWSSCRLYCEKDAPKSFIDSAFILKLLPKGKVSTKERYSRLLEQGDQLQLGEVLEQEDVIERFRSKLASMFPSLFRRIAGKKHIAGFSGIDVLDIEQLEKQAEAVRTGQFPNRPESKKAKKYLIEQLIARGYKRGEIAERLGISRKTVYNILKSQT